MLSTCLNIPIYIIRFNHELDLQELDKIDFKQNKVLRQTIRITPGFHF